MRTEQTCINEIRLGTHRVMPACSATTRNANTYTKLTRALLLLTHQNEKIKQIKKHSVILEPCGDENSSPARGVEGKKFYAKITKSFTRELTRAFPEAAARNLFLKRSHVFLHFRASRRCSRRPKNENPVPCTVSVGKVGPFSGTVSLGSGRPIIQPASNGSRQGFHQGSHQGSHHASWQAAATVGL